MATASRLVLAEIMDRNSSRKKLLSEKESLFFAEHAYSTLLHTVIPLYSFHLADDPICCSEKSNHLT